MTNKPSEQAMTDTAGGTIPTFAPVPVADLAPAQRESSPDTIALGNAILAVIGDGSTAAQEPTVHADKAAATKRAAVLKRAVSATGKVPDGRTVGARIVAADGGGFRVAVLLSTPKPRKAKDAPAATA